MVENGIDDVHATLLILNFHRVVLDLILKLFYFRMELYLLDLDQL